MDATTLIEHIADWHADLEVDPRQRLVRNVALTGLISKNGYRYSEQALKDAVALYEHKPVFLDHADDRAKPHVRSARDLVGSIVHSRFEDDRIRGDIRVLNTDTGRTFLALAESNAPGVGMSHVVLAERAGADGEVAKIHDVVSVDAVVFPATTTTFRESLSAQDTLNDADLDAETVAAEAEHPAEPVDGEDTESEAQRLRHDLQQLIHERDELLARLDSLQQLQDRRKRQRELEELIQSAELPVCVVTESFRQQLLAADDQTRRQLLEDRRTIVERLQRQRPTSAERLGGRKAASLTAQFIAAIKRRV